ncbi:hypothetical protein JQ597_13445 [Bradyrhizobium sp. AUGA SZCCT0177]|uniref:hypothetical protein n=1 Tax=Bradyrhizobium sp. AUGA SZCCT0177 TaxID=2807665 RepID=UPI001BACE353|nr:hypothetical protein [Bradyrhizobium sp. AUGA SZCCT0177]MBR1283045.1 hypothetical protein [Bradyrhizobium sp. AUGA SZCCT0177]
MLTLIKANSYTATTARTMLFALVGGNDLIASRSGNDIIFGGDADDKFSDGSETI